MWHVFLIYALYICVWCYFTALLVQYLCLILCKLHIHTFNHRTKWLSWHWHFLSPLKLYLCVWHSASSPDVQILRYLHEHLYFPFQSAKLDINEHIFYSQILIIIYHLPSMTRVKDVNTLIKHIKHGSTYSPNLYDIKGMWKWKQVL